MCFCEWDSGDNRRTLNHEAASMVSVQLMLMKGLLPYFSIQEPPETLQYVHLVLLIA